VIHAAEMEHAVHHHLDKVVRALRAHDHVTELARADGLAVVDRERQDVRRLVASPVLAVEPPDLVLGYERDRQVAVVDTGSVESRCGGRAKRRILGPVDLQVQRYDRCSRDEYSSYASTIRCTSLCLTTSSPPKRTNSIPSTDPRMSPITTSPDR
jgi:hypothetical protein